MMKVGFYMASTCFATQVVSINLLNTLDAFCQVEKNTYLSSYLTWGTLTVLKVGGHEGTLLGE